MKSRALRAMEAGQADGEARRELLVRAMHAEYLKGASLEDVGSKHGFSGGWLTKLFQRYGLATRGMGRPAAEVSPEQIAALHAEYAAGAPASLLALRHDRCGKWLLNQFVLLGLDRKASGRPRKDGKCPLVKDGRDKRDGRAARAGRRSAGRLAPLPEPSEKERLYRELRQGMNIQPVPEILQGLSR